MFLGENASVKYFEQLNLMLMQPFSNNLFPAFNITRVSTTDEHNYEEI